MPAAAPAAAAAAAAAALKTDDADKTLGAAATLAAQSSTDEDDKELTVDEMMAALDIERAREKARLQAEKEKGELRRRVDDLQGKSRLAEKELIIATRKANQPLAKALRIGGALANTIIAEVTDVGMDVVEALTPSWVQQQRQRRHYLLKVARAESAMGHIYADLAEARRVREEAKRAEAISWKTRRAQLANLAPTDTILHALMDEEKERKRLQEAEAFKARALAEAAATEAAQRAAADAHYAQRQGAKEAHSKQLAQYWAAAQSELLADARSRNGARAAELSAPPQQNLAREMRERAHGSAEEQVLGPTVDPAVDPAVRGLRSLGVFGVSTTAGDDSDSDSDGSDTDAAAAATATATAAAALPATAKRKHLTGAAAAVAWVKDAEGQWRRPVRRRASSSRQQLQLLPHLPGVDDAEVQLFSAPVHTEHEDRRTAAEEAEAAAARAQALYDALQLEAAECTREQELLAARRQRLEAEAVQLQEEHNEAERRRSLGDRDANEGEKKAAHLRKGRRAVIRDSLRAAQGLSAAAAARRRTAEAQSLPAARSLAVLRDAARTARASVEAENCGLGSLPVVVGRGLGSVPGLPQHSGTIEGGAAAVARRSRLVELREEVEAGLQVHRAAGASAQAAWLGGVELANAKADYDTVLSRLSAATDRLQKADGRDQREALVQGLHAFSTDGARRLLRNATNTHQGSVPWWQFRTADACTGVEQWCPPDAHLLAPTDERSRAATAATAATADACADVNTDPEDPYCDDAADGSGCNEAAAEAAAAAAAAARDAACGFALGPARVGLMTGAMPLPCYGLWTVQFIVRRRQLPSDPAAPVAPAQQQLQQQQQQALEGSTDDTGLPPPPAAGASPKAAQKSKAAAAVSTASSSGSNTSSVTAATGASDTAAAAAAAAAGDATDWVVVRLGGRSGGLTLVTTVKNAVDPDSGEVRHEVAHTWRGDALRWRFEFASSSVDPAAHLCVQAGRFKTHELPPYEEVDGRVVSKYVKLLRLEAKTPDARAARLLEDLIAAEACTDEQWDSDCLHDVPQRHVRLHYIALARAELDHLATKARTALRTPVTAASTTASSTTGGLNAARTVTTPPATAVTAVTTVAAVPLTAAERAAVRVAHSDAAYVHRKQAQAAPRIAQAQALTGRRVQIFDAAASVWRSMSVLQACIRWRDNGTEVAITHLLQPVDAHTGALLGPPGEACLDDLRWTVGSVPAPATPAVTPTVTDTDSTETAVTASIFTTKDAGSRGTQRSSSSSRSSVKTSATAGSAVSTKRTTAAAAKAAVSEGAQLMLQRRAEDRILSMLKARRSREAVAAAKSQCAALIAAGDATAAADIASCAAEHAQHVLNATQQETATATATAAGADGARSSSGGSNAVAQGTSLRARAARAVSGRAAAPSAAAAAGASKEAADRWTARCAAAAAEAVAVEYSERRKELLRRRALADAAEARVHSNTAATAAAAAAAAATTTAADAVEDSTALVVAYGSSGIDSSSISSREALKMALRIPHFERAVAPSAHCQHLRAKAWGSMYGTGERCLDCGLELTSTHEDSKQQAGIGSGDDPALAAAVERHRKNEGAYKPVDTDLGPGVSRLAVEQERIRLEKERRVIASRDDELFYDLDDTTAVYEFDLRHRGPLKRGGVIRQGVLWRREELIAAITEAAHKAPAAADAAATATTQDSSDNSSTSTALVPVDSAVPDSTGESHLSLTSAAQALAWHAATLRSVPLTYRSYDARRRARALDIRATFGRILGFQARVAALALQRRKLLKTREHCSTALTALHAGAPEREKSLCVAQSELAECERMLALREEAATGLKRWQEVETEAIADKVRAEMALAGQVQRAQAADAKLRLVGEQLQELLLQKLRASSKAGATSSALRKCTRKCARAVEERYAASDAAELLRHCRRGTRVLTSLGPAVVACYRASDGMVTIELPFGQPRARAWVLASHIRQLDRAARQAECAAMAGEDAATSKLRAADVAVRTREAALMVCEDELSRAVAVEASENAADRAAAKEILKSAKRDAPVAARGADVVQAAITWSRKQLEQKEAARMRAVMTWRDDLALAKAEDRDPQSVRLKPGRGLNAIERLWHMRRLKQEYLRTYVEKRMADAVTAAQDVFAQRVQARAQAAVLHCLCTELTDELIAAAAADALTDDAAAVARAQRETGLVFAVPRSSSSSSSKQQQQLVVHYSMYCAIRRQRPARVQELRAKIQTCKIHLAKGADRWAREEARFAAEAAARSAALAAAAVKALRARECAGMAVEERSCRAFYRAEWLAAREEKRRMAAADAEGRAYAAAVIAHERALKRAAAAAAEAEAALRGHVRKPRVKKRRANDAGAIGASSSDSSEDEGTYREQRREGIKNIKLQQRLARKERVLMAAEDVASHAENAVYTAAAAAAAAAAAQVAAAAALTAGVGSLRSLRSGASGGANEAGEPGLFIEEYVSSEESDLCEADIAYAAALSLPTGQVPPISLDQSALLFASVSKTNGTGVVSGSSAANKGKQQQQQAVSVGGHDSSSGSGGSACTSGGERSDGGASGWSSSNAAARRSNGRSRGTHHSTVTTAGTVGTGDSSASGHASSHVSSPNKQQQQSKRRLARARRRRRKAAAAAAGSSGKSSALSTTSAAAASAQAAEVAERSLRRLQRGRRRRIKRLRGAVLLRDAREKRDDTGVDRAAATAELRAACAELAWMQADEESRALQLQVARHERHVALLALHCQRKAAATSAATSVALKLRGHAAACTAALSAATAWRERCLVARHRAATWHVRVLKETAFFHGRALSGFWQRWETVWARQQLFELYFRQLVDGIAARAETIAQERRMMRLHDALVRNELEAAAKTVGAAALQRQHHRNELLALRRSALGAKLFGRTQRSILAAALSAWRDVHSRRAAAVRAFALRYALAKCEIDEQRSSDSGNGHSNSGGGSSASQSASHSLLAGPETSGFGSGGRGLRGQLAGKKTVMQHWKERTVRCRNCDTLYLASQNHAAACAYHPGVFKLSCPRHCTALTPACMTHRARRWSCCDATTAVSWGKDGCRARAHAPPLAGDAGALSAAAALREGEAAELAALDAALGAVEGPNGIVTVAAAAQQKQLRGMAEALKRDRDVVARFQAMGLSS